MIDIPGYRLRSLLQATGGHLLFRAVREDDQQPVTIKMPHMEHAGPRERTRYEREYRLLRRLQGVPGVPGVIGYQVLQETPVLIQEDTGGKPLSEQLGRPFEASHLLFFLIPLAATLAEVHRRGVIHKDIKPATLLLSENGRV